MDLTPNTTVPADPASVAFVASADAIGFAAGQLVAAVPDSPLVINGDVAVTGSVADYAAPLAPVAPVAPVAPAPAVAVAPVVALGAPAALAPLDSDDEDEDRAELESLSALAGDGDLFVASLKNLVSFAMDLGHDFETAFDAAAARVKTMFASKQ